MVSVKSSAIIIITWVFFFMKLTVLSVLFTNIFSIFLKQEHWFIVETVTQQQLSNQNQIRYVQFRRGACTFMYTHFKGYSAVITVVIGQSKAKICTLIYPHLLYFIIIIQTIII